MRIAVLVKQIPTPSQLRMVDGHVVRECVDLEVNAYCRRANAKAVELADSDGEVVLFTMGPPSAEDVLKEMIACGADRGVHLCDPVLSGSDTLATAVALAAAIRQEGPFDLILAGLNSLDGDTGQVPAEVAELLGLPFAAGVRKLEISESEISGAVSSETNPSSSGVVKVGGASKVGDDTGRKFSFTARLETDHGHRTVAGDLPAVLSVAERLCYPSKAPPDKWQVVPSDLISRVTAADLDVPIGRLGAVGSPTSVGAARVVEVTRSPKRAGCVAEAVGMLVELGVLSSICDTETGLAASSGGGVSAMSVSSGGAVSSVDRDVSPRDQPAVWCFFTEADIGVELLGEASELARCIDGTVTAVTTEGGLNSFISATSTVSTTSTDGTANGSDSSLVGIGVVGADRVLVVPDAKAGWHSEWAEHAEVLAAAAIAELPWVLLVEGTSEGRSVASTVAARHGWGLIGDVIGLEIDTDNRLMAWKPVFSGQVEVPIRSSSPVQMATIRPGALIRRPLRFSRSVQELRRLEVPTTSTRLRTMSVHNYDSNPGELNRAIAVVALGQGVDPSGYPVVDELCAALGGAALGATRKVTDKAWMPRNLQIGVTGHFVAPRLLVSVGASGRFNHTVGIRNAQAILAVNSNAGAEIFDQSDVGLVGTWQRILPELTAELKAQSLTVSVGPIS